VLNLTSKLSPRGGKLNRLKVAAELPLILVGLVMLFPLSARGVSPDDADGPRQPHIIFLFSDDQRADTIGALGNPHIKTPHLDSLVREGFVFRNAYCLGSDSPAVCLPSRNMLLSGRSYFRFSLYATGDDPNLPHSLRQAGYETYHHGKLGNTARELHKEFEHSRYVDDVTERTSGEPGKEIVDTAIEFLQERTDTRPLFMYLAFATPHDPRVADERFRGQYDPEELPLPANFLPEHPFDNGELRVRDEHLAAWPRTKDEIRGHLHDYYSVITGLDYHIGRLLSTLKELGIYENTILVYSSDHGLAVGSHGLMGKQNLYEHSMKVPLVFSGPGIPRGESSSLVYLLDLYPTLCGLAGALQPEGIDGRDLGPIVRGEDFQHRKALFLGYRDVQRAVRDERWKLICYPHINRCQLFDLENDPDELTDLVNDPDQQARITALREKMIELERKLGRKAKKK
jgi:arylsulfatase A-like enzyme